MIIDQRGDCGAGECLHLRAVEASLNAVAIAGLEGRLIYVNPAFLRIWGYEDFAELEGRHVTELWRPTESARQALSCLSKKGNWSGELIGERRDKSTFDALFFASFVTDEDKHRTHMVASIVDISSQKKLQEESGEGNQKLNAVLQDLRETQHQVIDQERRHAFLQLASGIAHDFNNSLSCILGYTDLLVHHTDLRESPANLKEYLKVVHSAATHASRTVRRMRKFYRPREKGEEHRLIDLSELCEEAIDITLPLWKHQTFARGITINVETDLTPRCLVRGNLSDLHEVIANLIINAIDAFTESGMISIRTFTKTGDSILEITDTGIGMSEETKRHCLEPFYTTKGESGSGLGLSIVQGVVCRHGGELKIESAYGEGTTLCISLPAAYDSGVETSTEPYRRAQCAISRKQQRILIVEDNTDLHAFLRDTCEKAGYLVDLAATPGDGLQKFYAGWYDIVVTSRAMPNMNGDKLAEIVKGTSTDKPVVMLTGYADIMGATGDRPDAVDVVVAKPVTAQALLDALSEILAPASPALQS